MSSLSPPSFRMISTITGLHAQLDSIEVARFNFVREDVKDEIKFAREMLNLVDANQPVKDIVFERSLKRSKRQAFYDDVDEEIAGHIFDVGIEL